MPIKTPIKLYFGKGKDHAKIKYYKYMNTAGNKQFFKAININVK